MTAPTATDDTLALPVPDIPAEPTPQGIRVTLADETWEFSEDTADSSELVDLENATGWTTGEWQDAVNRGSMRGLVALVWMLRRRNQPSLALNDVRFRVGDLKVEFITPAGKAESNGSSTPTSSRSPNTSGSSRGNSAGSAATTSGR